MIRRSNAIRVIVVVVLLSAIAALVLYGIGRGWLGRLHVDGDVTAVPVSPESLQKRRALQDSARSPLQDHADQQILFGDLHAHTAFSSDAFMMMLPLRNGGTRPPSDACDFARYCSILDFWSINDHAESLSPRMWQETVESIRQCNAVAGDPDNPDMVAFLGWEWSQVGQTAAEHYGHKNVVLRELGENRIPARPIASGTKAGQPAGVLDPAFQERIATFLAGRNRRHLDINRYFEELSEVPVCAEGVNTRDLPVGCAEVAPTPEILYRKLDEWGFDALLIPHNTAIGFSVRTDVDWATQLTPAQHDPARQRLIEIYSENGNSEEYRDYQSVAVDADGQQYCPAPQGHFVPQCWRAGEIVYDLCLERGRPESDCAELMQATRDEAVQIGFVSGHTVPGATADKWLDAGQCRDCFLPTYGQVPKGTVQYMLSLSNQTQAKPQRFRFGFIGSSDNHKVRPGTGYKDFDRRQMTNLYDDNALFDRIPTLTNDLERMLSYFLTGGLAAVHSSGRDRDSIWEALDRKEVYATSGDRILLWFDLINGPDAPNMPMGSETAMQQAPQFRVTAVGAFKQKPGCPAYTTSALSAGQIDELCRGECYNPSTERKLITRIEVIKISPQILAGEKTADLVNDPWLTHQCEPTQLGCTFTFDDPSFVQNQRDVLYYARAIEEPSEAIGGDPLRCEYDEGGACVKVNPCGADDREQCLATIEERAWSSPIFIDWQTSATP